MNWKTSLLVTIFSWATFGPHTIAYSNDNRLNESNSEHKKIVYIVEMEGRIPPERVRVDYQVVTRNQFLCETIKEAKTVFGINEYRCRAEVKVIPIISEIHDLFIGDLWRSPKTSAQFKAKVYIKCADGSESLINKLGVPYTSVSSVKGPPLHKIRKQNISIDDAIDQCPDGRVFTTF